MKLLTLNGLKNLKFTAFLRLFAMIKIPLLSSIRPRVVEIDNKRIVLRVPLNRRTKNHMGVMYFGALAMGAEASVGLRAVSTIRKMKAPVDFLFKDFNATFLRRAEGDVHFICEQGEAIEQLVRRCVESGERENGTFKTVAIVPKISDEPVAEFEVTLSLKRRGSRTPRF